MHSGNSFSERRLNCYIVHNSNALNVSYELWNHGFAFFLACCINNFQNKLSVEQTDCRILKVQATRRNNILKEDVVRISLNKG